MKKWLFCCLLSPLSVFACDFSAGKFQKITESEFSAELQLAKNGTFTLTRESWMPGQHPFRESHTWRGTWECSKNKLTLHYAGQSVEDRKNTVGRTALWICGHLSTVQLQLGWKISDLPVSADFQAVRRQTPEYC